MSLKIDYLRPSIRYSIHSTFLKFGLIISVHVFVYIAEIQCAEIKVFRTLV